VKLIERGIRLVEQELDVSTSETFTHEHVQGRLNYQQARELYKSLAQWFGKGGTKNVSSAEMRRRGLAGSDARWGTKDEK